METTGNGDKFIFAPEDERSKVSEPAALWKVLIVDDDEDVHKVTRIALTNFLYKNKKLVFLNAYSGKEAEKLIQEHSDIALILLDVVMESDQAGLELVKYIRATLANKFVRIVLRTGQAGKAPEKDVIEAYEINDYKTKTELTRERLYTLVLATLRSYETLIELESFRHELEIKVMERTLELLKQKEELAQKNVTIADSIRYASYIQYAIFTSEAEVKKIFQESFILYKPRDIVSGDFYWFFKRDNKIFFCAADCTGHGVPGALISMLGVTFLNEILLTNKYISANELLNELRLKVINSLHQKGLEGEQQDSMDIALCCLNTDTKELQFSGANNPLWIIKKQQDAVGSEMPQLPTAAACCQLLELKPDRMPIGIYPEMSSFKNNHVTVNKGDCLYLFSDGYQDQYGGPDKKKFRPSQLKELILTIYEKPMQEQQDILTATFENWRGNEEQTDDVLVLGIRL
ncbi:MAG: SpoIIE family protein phosphatase [Bacteroidetes bacterium]|nr:SpoIIE family protein phosphatase [Bacteroidota bacterium]